MTYLSIVIPAYNEADRLPRTLFRLERYLATQSYSWEIVVVSNGSSDGTDEWVQAQMARLTQLHLVSLSERGKGRAVRAGVHAAVGEVVFLCDADLSMPPHEISRFLEAVKEVDVVIGSREAPGACRYAEPWHRHLMGRVFNRLVRALAVPGIADTQCGFKAFRRGAAEALFSRQTLDGFGFDVEILFLARKWQYRMTEIGVEWYFDGASRVRPGVDTVHMLRELLTIRLQDSAGLYRRPAAGTVSLESPLH